VHLSSVLKALQIEAFRSAIEEGWPESCRTQPGEGIFFLSDSFVSEAAVYVGLSQKEQNETVQAATRIRKNPELKTLAWHAFCRLQADQGLSGWPEKFPGIPDGALLYLLVLFARYPQVRALHETHAVPHTVVADTMADIDESLRRYRRKHRQPGLFPAQAGNWLQHHMKGRIYRLGRLKYIPRKFPGECYVYRHRSNGEVVVLAVEGLCFRADGQKNGASWIIETQGLWTSRFCTNGEWIEGHVIDPVHGAASSQSVRLRKDDWLRVLAPGDPVLDIHISSDASLNLGDCIHSVNLAMQFFSRHFPEQPVPQALVCNSWLLDAQLALYLRPESNIINFQRQFYLYPVGCDAWSSFRFVFDMDIPYGSQDEPDMNALPRETRLQRALVDHVQAGGRWRKGGGFILTAHLPWERES